MKPKNVFAIPKIVSVILLCIALTACSQNIEKDAAIEVTEDFVVMYYVAGDTQASLYNTSGQARAKIEKKLSDISDEPAGREEEEIQKEPVAYKLLGARKTGEYSYNVRWRVWNEEGWASIVDVEASNSREGWHILDFTEKASVPLHETILYYFY